MEMLLNVMKIIVMATTISSVPDLPAHCVHDFRWTMHEDEECGKQCASRTKFTVVTSGEFYSL